MSIDSSEEYEKAARRLLALLVKVSGWTQRRLDSQLGYAVGHTSRLFKGSSKLLYVHILDILGVIGIEPARFFDALHPSTSPLQLLELVERARRISEGAEKDPAVLPVADRVQLAIDRFRVEIGKLRVRGGAHSRSESPGGAPARKRPSSARKRSS